MIYPELNVLKALASGEKDGTRYQRATVYREVIGDTLTPIALLRNFSNDENLFLLESANLDKSMSRFSFFGRNPARIITYKDGVITDEKGGAREQHRVNPMEYLSKEFSSCKGYNDGTFGDFAGGFVGTFGYEAANYMGNLRHTLAEPEDQDLISFFEVTEFYVFDNRMGRVYAACSIPLTGELDDSYEKALERTADMAAELHGLNFSSRDSKMSLPEKEFDEPEYVALVKQLKNDIENGEAIQVVLSNRFEINARVNATNFYRTLRNINPSPYMFFLKFGQNILCGSSPEIHLKVVGRQALLKPIAGTYPVSPDIEAVKAALLNDPKELAEHLMLLDLARNDIYAACEPESVRVHDLFQAEVYSHVVHIVSSVSGQLRGETTALDAFMKSFPAGTVSGAPKVRAMELISRYENTPRGFYAGCVGYFGYNGSLDTCITIRSALITPDKMIMRAGAGIVYDSNPESEYKEVNNKLNAMFAACARLKDMEASNVFTRG